MTLQNRTNFSDAYLAKIWTCRKCSARVEARLPVPPRGDPLTSLVLLVGRNPGRDEDVANQPFVGPSGKLLTKFLSDAGIPEEICVVSNLCLCHTTNDRDMTPDEIVSCRPFLNELIYMMPQLQIIIPLGAATTKAFGIVDSVVSMTGVIFPTNRRYVVMPCLHPGAALHNGTKYRSHLIYAQMQLRRFLQSKGIVLLH